MTIKEYQAIRELIESKFRKDMAALERVWFTIHGVNPPESVVELEPREDTTAQAAAAQSSPTGFEKASRAELKAMTPEQRKTYKAAYMRDYAARNKVAK